MVAVRGTKKKLCRKRFSSQMTSGCVALGYSIGRPIFMIVLMTILLCSQLMFMLWSLYILIVKIPQSPAPSNDSIFHWSPFFSIHCLIQAVAIAAVAFSHLMRLSVRFIQEAPDRFLLMMQINEASLWILTFVTTLCSGCWLFKYIPDEVQIGAYLGCSWLFIVYHFMINTLISKSAYKFLKRHFFGIVNNQIEPHRNVGEFDDVEQTAKEIFEDICNASEISIILDALKLTGAFQRYRKLRSKKLQDLESGAMVSELDMHPVDDLKFYARAVKYAIGIYGLYATFTQNPRRFFRYFLGREEHRRKKGFMIACDVKEEDIIVNCLKPSLFLPSYVIFADHENRQIWMALSGSSSVHDLLTDLHAHPIPVNVEGLDPMFAHAGIWKSAVNLHQQLFRSEELKKFLIEHPDYELVLTGHSLGAAAAAAMVVLLKNDPLPASQDRNVRVIGFGCPPIFSAPLDLPGVTQVAIVDDFITQLNLRSIKFLVSEMSVLTNTICSSSWRKRMPRRWACDYEAQVRTRLFEFFDSIDTDSIEDEIEHHFRLISNKDKHIQLYVPGKKVALRPIRDSIEDDDVGITDGILITPTMLSSHTYLSHQAALEQAIRRAEEDVTPSISCQA